MPLNVHTYRYYESYYIMCIVMTVIEWFFKRKKREEQNKIQPKWIMCEIVSIAMTVTNKTFENIKWYRQWVKWITFVITEKSKLK